MVCVVVAEKEQEYGSCSLRPGFKAFMRLAKFLVVIL